uniref:Uncharacterized protein n=2 Tax=Oryza barthii TaxID=65489 RepID=A0A0D3HTL7_9ORYZ
MMKLKCCQVPPRVSFFASQGSDVAQDNVLGLYKQTVDAIMCILLHTKYHPLQSHVCCYSLLSGIHSSFLNLVGGGVRFPRHSFYSDYMLSLGKTELSGSRKSFSLADLRKFAKPQPSSDLPPPPRHRRRHRILGADSRQSLHLASRAGEGRGAVVLLHLGSTTAHTSTDDNLISKDSSKVIFFNKACVEEKGKRGKFVGEEIDRLQWAPVVLEEDRIKSLVPILYMAVMIVDIDQDLFRVSRTTLKLGLTFLNTMLFQKLISWNLVFILLA